MLAARLEWLQAWRALPAPCWAEYVLAIYPSKARDQIFLVILAGNGGIEPWLKGDIWGYEGNS